jgi:hypothetical protein
MAYGYNGDLNYRNNPFLDMENFREALEPQRAAQLPQQAAQPPQQQQAAGEAGAKVKLPEFWPHAPGIWFARAELRFETSGVVADRQMFAYVVDALPYESLCLVADLVETPPMFDAYNILKERLLMSHQLTPVQKAAKLMALPDLGTRRPSQLLADLLQLCPPGEQNTAFFRASFLQRLPASIQVHLAHTDTLGSKELAQRADQLTLTNSRPEALMVAVTAEPAVAEDSIVAAVANNKSSKAG